jgi:hypothetical protein
MSGSARSSASSRPTRHRDRLRIAGQQLPAVGLDQHIDHERTPRLALAGQAVAAVDEEGSDVSRWRTSPQAQPPHVTLMDWAPVRDLYLVKILSIILGITTNRIQL